MAIFVTILVTCLVITPLSYIGSHFLIGIQLVKWEWYRKAWKSIIADAEEDQD